MIKLAFENLLNQALVYNRNPQDPTEPPRDFTPLKFTHVLVETNGAQLLYNEKTQKLYADLRQTERDHCYHHLPFSLSVVEVARHPIDSLHQWMISPEHYAVRLEYQGPKVPVRVMEFIEYLKKRTVPQTTNPHVIKPEDMGLVSKSLTHNLKLIISCDPESDKRVLAVYDNFEVREVLYDAFDQKYKIDNDNEALVYAGPDAEQHYQQLVKELSRRPHRVYSRATFAPPSMHADDSDFSPTVGLRSEDVFNEIRETLDAEDSQNKDQPTT